MNYRPLGKTGLTVSEIGFGCWGIGGAAPGTKSYGPTDDAQSIAAVHRAVEVGITFFDTSDLYGRGHSEELLGSALRGRRDKVVIASKVGIAFNAEGKQYQEYSTDHMRRSVEGSLLRLQTDYLDLYQLHDPPMDGLKANPAPLDTMKALQKEGKVRAWGISVASPADGLRAAAEFGAPAIQFNFNMIDQRAVENGLLALAAKLNTGLIGRTPLCFGFLTGCYGPDTRFDPADHRSGWSGEQIALWASAPTLFREAIKPPADQSATDVAMRFCLSYPQISVVIPGILTPREVDLNAQASNFGPLSETQRLAAERAYRENVFFVRKR